MNSIIFLSKDANIDNLPEFVNNRKVFISDSFIAVATDFFDEIYDCKDEEYEDKGYKHMMQYMLSSFAKKTNSNFCRYMSIPEYSGCEPCEEAMQIVMLEFFGLEITEYFQGMNFLIDNFK